MVEASIKVRDRDQACQEPELRYLLQETDTFVTCVELVTSRGLMTDRDGRKVLELARGLANNSRVNALSITDNPGGNAMIGPDILGRELLSQGQEVTIHLSCKDWNRNGLQSRGWELASSGFKNILSLSGDYPIDGYRGIASGVFDTDSVGLLKMFSDMNEGLKVGEEERAQVLKSTDFFLGAVVNNYKRFEREVMPQYFKLAKKVESGAKFIINQIGYDSQKQDELLKYMVMFNIQVPVISNVYVLSGPSARFFHRGNIPGVTVTDNLLALVLKQAKSPDKGKAFFLELAAKQCAIARGLGYRGVYLGGHLKYKEYEQVLRLADALKGEDWRKFAKEINFCQPEEFYFFERDFETGLSSTQINQEYLHSKRQKVLAKSRKNIAISYKINRVIHESIFEEKSFGFLIGKKIFHQIDRGVRGLKKFMHGVEQVTKILAFDCRDCGDCSLPDIAFLCPESQCIKNQRNGPCGGTRSGKCEIGEKDCIWALAYDRLKAYGEEEQMLDRPVVFKDGALKGTSAWVNAFLGRDYHSRKE